MSSPLITVCLLNYKRPENIAHVLNSIEIQTVPTKVYVWDNSGGNLPLSVGAHPLVKMVITPSKNVGCFPRWWMASVCGTEYVCSLDDDLVFTDENVLADAIDASRNKCPEGIVGFFGWQHVEGRSYHASHNVYNAKEDCWADIIKGRFMLFRRALLEKVPLEIPKLPRFDGLSHREDDIYVSLCIAGGRWGAHLVPGILRERWYDLPQREDASSGKPEHYQYRDKSIKAIRQWLGEGELG